MKTKRNLIQMWLLGAALMQAVMAGLVAHADTINWTNTTSGGWNTAANWNPNTVPGATDTAIVTNAGVTVSLNGATTVGAIILGTNGTGTVTLALAGQTLALNGPLTVNPSGSFAVDGGALMGNANNVLSGTIGWSAGSLGGSLTLAAGSTLNITTTNDHTMRACTFNNNGSVIWTSGQVLCGETLYMRPGTTITNNGLWDSHGDLTLNGDVGYPGTVFNNLGTFRKSAGINSSNTVITSQVVFNQLSGVLDVQQGNLVLQGGGSFTGGTATNNNGVLWLSGGNFNLNGTVTGTNVIENGGNLFGGILIQGGLQWQSGSWGFTDNYNNWHSAGVTLNASGLLMITTTNDHSMRSSTFINNGSVIWNGGQICCGEVYYMAPNTIITNSGVWDAQGDLTLNGDVGYLGTFFNNLGTFRKSAGTGNTILTGGVTFNNTGKLDAQSGNIALQGAYTLANGTQMSFGLGGPVGNGSISLSGAASFAGSLNVNLNNFYWPAAGSSFNLLNYTAESGLLFTNTSLPAPGYLAWQTNYNPTALTLTVVARSTNAAPGNLNLSTLNGTNLILQWPGDHTGWSIQVQTNPVTVGLSTNWATLAGSSQTNQFVMPINKTNGTLFFRMIYP
jgi:hypothetical protein